MSAMQDGRRRLAVAIVALAVFALAYEAIRTGGLMETSAFFVGLPALLALVVTLGRSPASAEGILLKTLTIAILLAICTIVTAPLFSAGAVAVVGLTWLASAIGSHTRRSAAPARLYVGASCDACSQTGAWIAARDPRGLELVPAETAPWPLRRMTYVAADGHRADGVAALGRALGHASRGWALLGIALRLPAVRPVMQLIVDGSGGGPREIGTLQACRADWHA